MQKSNYMQDGEKFRKFFHQNLNKFCKIFPTWELYFDTFAFENFLIEHGYDEDSNESMKEYVEREFGKEASDFILYLLD